MFDDETNDGGIGISIPALGAVGEVMLILFVTVIMSMSIKAQMIRSSAFGSSRGDETPAIGLNVLVGPGKQMTVEGEPADLDTLLARAEKIGEDKKILVQMDTRGDPVLFWEVRYKLRDKGFGYMEAPPVKPEPRRGEKK